MNFPATSRTERANSEAFSWTCAVKSPDDVRSTRFLFIKSSPFNLTTSYGPTDENSHAQGDRNRNQRALSTFVFDPIEGYCSKPRCIFAECR